MEVFLKTLELFIIAFSVFVRANCLEPLEINGTESIGNVSSPIINETCGAGEACVRFCCNNETICSTPSFFDLSSLKAAENLERKFKVLKGSPLCSDMYEQDGNWTFTKNGSVLTEANGVSYVEAHDNYCYGHNGSEHVLICFPPEDEFGQQKNESNDYFPYLMLVSVPFCVATFFVYLCLPDLRNLHGKCVMCYLFGMICLFLTFPLIQINQGWISSSSWFCEFSGYIAYISILICFFWLNIMCYDIYSTFRRIQGSSSIRRTSGKKCSGNKQFLIYCLYAFGVPIVISILVFVLDHWVDIPGELKIRMGEERCWIGTAENVDRNYVYIPMSCLLLLNLVFYSITSYKIFQVQKQTLKVIKADNSHYSRINAEKTRFFLYLRLFVIMGVPWLLEILSWYFTGSAASKAFDVLNALQGVLIFMLFVWKPKIKKIIVRKWSASKTVSASSSSQKCSVAESSMMSDNRFDSKKLNHVTYDCSLVESETELADK